MYKKATAEAPANLAFVKYWGKKNAEMRLPINNSISVNLSNAKTVTTVEFDSSFTEDKVVISGTQDGPGKNFTDRIVTHLDRVRVLADIDTKALVTTENTFPHGVGIASSASGFAALTLAATFALDLGLDTKELSALARLGSGSACRSIPDGFTEWIAGNNQSDSYAVQIVPPTYWNISIITVVVSKDVKKLSSTDGHTLATASPFFEARLRTIPERLALVRGAIINRDFETFGRESEKEALSFHAIAMTSPIDNEHEWFSGGYYWLPDSLELILAVQKWRTSGLRVYFTLDAGPTVHLICLQEDVPDILSAIQELEKSKLEKKWEVLINYPAIGAHIIS